MQCPRCHHASFEATGTCPQCGFYGDSDQIEELSRLQWLLREIDSWTDLGILESTPEPLKSHYRSRLQQIQTSVGLFYPPFTASEAREASRELRQLEMLFNAFQGWQEAGFVKAVYLPAYYARLLELRARFQGQDPSQDPLTDRERLEDVDFLLGVAEELQKLDNFTSSESVWSVTAPLWAEKAKLELLLSSPATIQPRDILPGPEVTPLSVSPSTVSSSTEISSPAVVSPLPRPSLRERLWRSILSERTLQALLFLGIFLLFVAAISFVVWGWNDFSAPVRVAIPFAFTILFFGLGRIVHLRTRLYRSAIAVSAIAALLVPIDSYTIYANYGSPPAGWPLFWLITSLACLVVYTPAALQIKDDFFAYLTGIAIGSTALAALEVFTDISRDWYSAALSVLAAVLIVLATRLAGSQAAREWQVFARPFRYLALWIPAILMPLTLGLRLVTRGGYDSLHYAMALNWLIGGFIFGWGAVFHRSRSLGLLAAVTLPVSVYMIQGALFQAIGVNPAWHAFGLACLTPLYLYTGYRLSAFREDEVLVSHGETATRWGIVLVVAAALLSLTDLTSGLAAAASHAVLSGSMVLAAIAWRRPRTLYAASFFSFSAFTFGMTELGLALNQLGVGWVSLAIVHILLVLFLARSQERLEERRPFLVPLVIAAYSIGFLALLPSLFLYQGQLLSYALGNWIAISGWGAYLAHRKQAGFVSSETMEAKKSSFLQGVSSTNAIYHWFTALPLPFWVWIVTRNNQLPEPVLPLLLVVLAWVMVLISHWLRFAGSECRAPWRLTGLVVSVAAPVIAFLTAAEGYTPGITLIAIGILYFADTFASQEGSGFYPAGLTTAGGIWFVLMRAHVDAQILTLVLSLLAAVYILAGLEMERRKYPFATLAFLSPIYHVAHVLALCAIARVYIQPLAQFLGGPAWSDAMQLWGAAVQLLLAIVYGVFAWGRYQEEWGHIAAWLAMAGGGFIAIVFSQGHGSLAAKGALIAAVMVLAERSLNSLRQHGTADRHRRALFRLVWHLYRRPLLVAGWTASAGIVGLALVRNLVWLGGGRIQQIWAAIGLLLITALYAVSARLFKRARFVWLAVLVLFAPWTILTHLGWFTSYKPTLSEFAISWTVLAWLLFALRLGLERHTPAAYIIPLKTGTHLLLPFSMLWAVSQSKASLYTVGLAIALYGTSAWLDHRRASSQAEGGPAISVTKFFYPALGLLPLWFMYGLDHAAPSARHEHFGLVLLAFGALAFLMGIQLERLAPIRDWARAYGLPAYLTSYLSLTVGTLLVIHRLDLLIWALLYVAVLMAASARHFRTALWLYPGTALTALSLLVALHEANIPVERQGWWLIGFAALYLAFAWLMRRNGQNETGRVLITMAFAFIALGLPPSSLDQIGAIWGYGGAALLYAVSAFWLRQPLLLIPACALAVVPYAGLLQRSAIRADYYGLSLFPGALTAFSLGIRLDRERGAWMNFPWEKPGAWLTEFAKRLLDWWALPLYGLGLGLATAAPFFANGRAGFIALNLVLLAGFYGWAVYRFKLRVWLVLAILAVHYGLAFYLETFQLWRRPDEAWLRYLPLTAILLATGLFLEKRLEEGSPVQPQRLFRGWSRPFYLFLLLDLLFAQMGGLRGSYAGAQISLFHMLVVAVLASAWSSSVFSYLSPLLGFAALLQWRAASDTPGISLPVHLAGLALGYGLLGFGYELLMRRREEQDESRQSPNWHSLWKLPLQRMAMIISIYSLGLAAILGIQIVSWSVLAILGIPFRQIVDLETVYMIVWVLSLNGLMYAAAAATYRQIRLGYLAIAMLLAGWFTYAFYIHAWDNLIQLQWYAMPAGIYLLGIGYVEWQRGNRDFARWLDYAAMLLLLGSLFWQTLVFGWWHALLLGAEGFAAFWWGSARRLRRFFYAGMAGVILATVGQLLNALQEVNQWITFGLIGLLLVIMAIIVERKLEAIKAWQQVLEAWE